MIKRCAATEVDPETAARDIAVPDALYRLTGEDDCGIYAEVIAAGRIAQGDPIKIIG
jgi:MOSC domain-containing protein YiiM